MTAASDDWLWLLESIDLDLDLRDLLGGLSVVGTIQLGGIAANSYGAMLDEQIGPLLGSVGLVGSRGTFGLFGRHRS